MLPYIVIQHASDRTDELPQVGGGEKYYRWGGGGGGSTTSTTQKSLSHISLFFTAGETFRGGSGKLFQDCKEYCLLELPSLNFFKRYPSVNVIFPLLDIKNRK